MGGRHGGWPARIARPAVRKLDVQETQAVVEGLGQAIHDSPVLTALGYRVQARRGRFYLESDPDGTGDFGGVARVTPLADKPAAFLLEVERGSGDWSEEYEGTIRGIGKCVAGDRKGTFHGLGRLDLSIRKTLRDQRSRLLFERQGPLLYHPILKGTVFGVPEVLFHVFEVPIPVIAKPRGWYEYHRKPSLREIDEAEERILVDFTAEDSAGYSFGGKCLYCKHDGKWNAFRIKPDQSASIASSLAWLEKRGWKPW